MKESYSVNTQGSSGSTFRPGHIRRASTTLDLMPSRLPPKRDWTYYFPVFGWIKTLLYMMFHATKLHDQKKFDEETVESRAQRAKLTSNGQSRIMHTMLC